MFSAPACGHRLTQHDTHGQIQVTNLVTTTLKRQVKRRVRSPHPGVVLVPPRGRHVTWRARFVDPETGRTKAVRLDPMALRTAEARRQWAIKKARSLIVRKTEIEAGAPRATGTPLDEALKRFFEDHPRLRPRTLRIYQDATDKLATWAARRRIRTADDLTGPRLLDFRASLAAEPRQSQAKGGRRGEYAATKKPRAESTVNVELRAVRTVLDYVRRLGLLPKLTGDAVKDSLKQLPVSRDRIEFLRPPEIRRLLDAARRHDAATFKVTRAEHRKGGPPVGSTTRYEPIEPFVRFVLLTGMRLGEAIDLEWSQVDLDTSEIHLSSTTKTKRARTVDLSVCPSVADLMGECGEGRVFANLTRDLAADSAKRLKEQYGAPESFSWQALRRTCGTFLTNAPGIFGAASAYRSARQLGHSVAVAEKHYLGVVKVSPAATTLEAAMGVG